MSETGEDVQGRPLRNVTLRVSQIFSACTFCKARKIKVRVSLYTRTGPKLIFPSAMVQLQHVVAASSLADKQHVLSQRNLQIVGEIIQLIFDKRLKLPNNASANTTLDRTISLRRQILSGPTGMNQRRLINGLSSIHL
jgi:hypothetical protein